MISCKKASFLEEPKNPPNYFDEVLPPSTSKAKSKREKSKQQRKNKLSNFI